MASVSDKLICKGRQSALHNNQQLTRKPRHDNNSSISTTLHFLYLHKRMSVVWADPWSWTTPGKKNI